MSPSHTLAIPNTRMEKNFSIKPAFFFSVLVIKQIQVGNDQEKAQSERNSYSKSRGGKKQKQNDS